MSSRSLRTGKTPTLLVPGLSTTMAINGMGSFDPRSISGLLAWYDFSDGSTLYTDAGTTLVSADGQSIYRATNKANPSTVYAENAVLAGRPTYKVNILNGRSLARFDGGDSLTENATINEKPSTLIAVCMASGTAGYRGLFGSTGAALEYRLADATNKPELLQAATAAILTGTTGVSAGTYYTLSATYSGVGAAALYTNGAANGTATNDLTLTVPSLVIGNSAGEFWVGDIAEMLIYNSVLSSSQHNAVGTYLSGKYAITWTTMP